MTLKLAKDLSLPLSAVTQKLAWLGVTGSGKTYGASKLAELFWHAGAQFLVIDPVGVWYGLRLAKDGKKPSAINIPIFGGLHGDVPLEPTGGELLANLVVDKALSCILDVSQFESDADKARFAKAFADRFFFRKKSQPSAVHLFIEEVQEFVPQNPQRGEEQMLHAFIRMQKLGRNFGIGSSYISQRPQEVNKKALNMAQTLFVFRTTGTHERTAIEKWIEDKSLDESIADDLPKIHTGHCHVWSPEFLRISEMAHILEKETFNASATPEVGAVAKARELAPIDLDKVRTEMAATIEKAKADDPRELRKQIAELKRQAEQRVKQAVETASNRQVKTVEKPALTEKDREILTTLSDRIHALNGFINTEAEAIVENVHRKVAAAINSASSDMLALLGRTADEKFNGFRTLGLERVIEKLAQVQPSPITPQRAQTAARPSPQGRRVDPGLAPSTSTRPASLVSNNGAVAEGLTKAEQRVLDAVAWWKPAGISAPTRHQVAFVARYTVNGHFNNLVGGLRTKGLIDYPTGGGVTLTSSGETAANAPADAPSRDELIARVLDVLKGDAMRRIFSAVVNKGGALSRDELAAATNYTVNGHFNNMVGALRSLGVIEYPHGGGVELAQLFDQLPD